MTPLSWARMNFKTLTPPVSGSTSTSIMLVPFAKASYQALHFQWPLNPALALRQRITWGTGNRISNIAKRNSHIRAPDNYVTINNLKVLLRSFQQLGGDLQQLFAYFYRCNVCGGPLTTASRLFEVPIPSAVACVSPPTRVTLCMSAQLLANYLSQHCMRTLSIFTPPV